MPELNLELPSLEEFASSNPDLLEKETNSTPDIPSLEEFAKTYSPSKKSAKPSNPDKIVFQPANVDWSLSKLNSIQEFYKNTFNQDLPLRNVGQGEVQNKFKLDHRSSADVGLNPDSAEGQKLISYLKENNIPFLAFKKAIPGVSTGPHIHIGRPSKHTDITYYVGQTVDSQNPPKPEDLPSLEEFAAQQQQQAELPSLEEFAQTPEMKKEKDQTAPLELVDLTSATDPNRLDFKPYETQAPTALSWFTKYNKPVVTGQNPYQVGDLLETEFEYDHKPDTNTAIDYLLQKWNPEYADLNANFRAETGGLNILNVQNQEGFVESLGNNKYKVKARPTRGAMALLEAYKTGGLPAYNTTLMLINQQKEEVLKKNRMDLALIQNYREQHPYISAFESAFEREAESSTQLAQNLKYLAKASFLSAYKGGNSKEYLDLINQEKEEQKQLDIIGSGIYNPPSLEGKIIAGATAGVVALPRFVLAGKFGSAGLPLMVYAEHLHKGNREAAIAALPMAILSGAMHGAGEFYSGTEPKEVNYLDKNGNLKTKTIRVESPGTAAPTARVPKTAGQFTQDDLSLFTQRIAKGPEVSIRNLTPLERQLVLRGGNALALTGTSLITNPHQSLSDIVSSIAVGLTYPVGKGPKEARYAEYTGEPFRPVNIRGTGLLTGEGLPDLSQQLEQMRIDVPLTPTPTYGKFPIIEQERGIKPVLYPPAETPDVAKYAPLLPDGTRDISNPLGYVAETETGFQARGQGQTLHLDLDTANLNLLELKRSLEDGSYKTQGDDNKTVLQKQQAIKNAIAVLEQAIPEETKAFFEANEDVIRTALKTNYEATQAKESLIQRRAESLKPENIKPNVSEVKPVTTGEETPQEIFGDNGVANEGTSQEGARKFVDDLFKITTMGQRGSVSNKPLEGKGIVQQTKDELNYLSAFFIEDLYKRGVVPTVDAIANKIKVVAGDAAKYITDDQLKQSFNAGMNYYNANVADPFFSRMKQDAAEKLPKRFTEEQARNILAQHKDEFEWTAGLQDFLNANKGKKINKQDLIDVINKGQVKVEASIASDEGQKYINEATNDYLEKYAVTNEIRTKNGLYNEAKQVAREAPNSKKETDILNLIKLYETYGSELPRYSLRAYPHENLELPGAENSREVKLISPLVKEENFAENWERQTFYDDGEAYGWENKQTGEVAYTSDELTPPTNYMSKDEYRSPHWNERNVVAHYRSSDRTTFDGTLRLLFGEEFQSDWNHDIRERGIKYSSNPELAIQHAKNAGYYIEQTNDGMYTVKLEGRMVPFLIKGETEAATWKMFLEKEGVEPNPFMQHSWKELIMKRFLRDAAIATNASYDPKAEIVPARETEFNTGGDEIAQSYWNDKYFVKHGDGTLDGDYTLAEAQEALKQFSNKYKYDAVGWTTARQQMQRYGALLEGKNFWWKKNSDGTYSFDFQSETNGDPNFRNSPHELQNISLERFAELTTPEAAQEVRDQEAKISKEGEAHYKVLQEQIDRYGELSGAKTIAEYMDKMGNSFPLEGQFSLKEAVELRKGGEDKYDDYDTALVNIAKKIGKRFGAKYSVKEIKVPKDAKEDGFYELHDEDQLEAAIDRGEQIYNYNGKPISNERARDLMTEQNQYVQVQRGGFKTEKIHSLEITPSMRQSLEKEGLPLYGLGGQEPLKSPETGIRNQLTTIEGFNQHRDLLVKSLYDAIPKQNPEDLLQPSERLKFQQAIAEANKEDLDNFQLLIDARKGNVFNSGLSPDAFIDQAKLLYNGIQDFKTFSAELLQRFGEQVKPFLQDLWIQVKNLYHNFNKEDYKKGTGGTFNLGLNLLDLFKRREQPEAEKKYRKEKKITDKLYSINRGVMNAQLNPEASDVYDVARVGQRDKNYFLSSVLGSLRSANRIIKSHHEQDVAETIFIGNETQRLFTDAELAAGDAATGRPALNTEQIQAYKDAYKAEHTVLDKRLQQVLFAYRERAQKITDRLASTTNPAQITNLNTQLLDIADAMRKATDHFTRLKNEGYISLKRKGPIAAFVQDPAFPVGDKRGELYRQFDSVKEAGKWIKQQEQLLGANPTQSDMYDVRVPEKLRAAANKLTPGQFEELVDSSGVNPKDPSIEQLREEIYTRYPSAGYELKRDYVRGYDRSWQFVLESIADQTEAYANSFYSRVAGEHMIKALNATSLQQTNYELYRVLQKYIDHEISSPEASTSSALASYARKGVYLFQLGGDVNQLYLNAIAQPVTQTYSYFARVQHNGQMLGLGQPEKYWVKGWKLANDLALKKTNTPQQTEFRTIYDQLKAEGVVSAEFNKSLLELETEKTVQSRLKQKSLLKRAEHWSGAFMRAGEVTTRTHAAAEAYLVGKEVFNLNGQELTNFIVRAIDATQSNPSRAEAPLIVRGSHNTGEFRKSVYQFNAFNHMWVENLALNVKSDFQNRRISATARHIAPVVIMGGFTGVPLAGLMSALAQGITGQDPRKKFHELTKNVPFLERLALYGITTNATLSNKLSPTIPFVEDVAKDTFLSDKTWSEILITSRVPAITTAGQFAAGVKDLYKGDYLRGIGGVVPVKPIRNLATAYRYGKEGIRARGGSSIVPKSKVTPITLFSQGLGVSPASMTEFYENKTHTGQVDLVRKVRNEIVRKVKKHL